MTTNPGRDMTEILADVLTAIAKWLLGLGAVATAISTGLLVYTCFRVTGSSDVSVQEALRNILTFERILLVGLVGVAVGSTYLFWGEEILGAIQLLWAAALWFSPIYLPMLLEGTTNEVVSRSIDALQNGGAVFGVFAIAVLLSQLVVTVRQRSKHGTKADHLRYGKGVKEDVDRQNIFMGKCWQLPFCRKFVRERCPIYHSGRTCWKERVGCMCEEQVIRNALANKVIPKDSLMAAKAIPRNFQLTETQKKERCRNCVIYNEHQKHKYRLVLPLILLTFIVGYVVLRTPLLAATASLVATMDRIVQAGTLGGVKPGATPMPFIEALLVVFLIVALSYSLKVAEYVIFKLKM